MQAYEHIVSSILNLDDCMTKEEILRFMRKYGAYITLPDSIRGAVYRWFGKAYRQPSHFSEGAYIKYAEILKRLKDIDENGFPEGSIYIPEGLQTRAADGMTSLECAKECNQGLINLKEWQFVMYHLIQDSYSDKLFQEYIASCYVECKTSSESLFKIYGVEVEDSSARLNQTNRIISMSEFRRIVELVQRLSTLELYRRLSEKNKGITFDDIKGAVFKSYDDNYPECMQNAKRYVVPNETEQDMILGAIAGKDNATQYYTDIKRKLVEIGAFKSIKDIEDSIKAYIDETTFENRKTNNRRESFEEISL